MSLIRDRIRKFSRGPRRDVLLSAIITPLGLGLMFGLYLLLGRSLPVEEFGKFTFVIQLASTGAILVSAGLPVSAQKFIPYYTELADNERLNSFLTWSFSWLIITVVALAFASVLMHLTLENKTGFHVALSMIPISIWLWQRYTALGHDNLKLALVPRDILVSIFSILAFLCIDVKSGQQAVIIYNTTFLCVMFVTVMKITDRRYVDYPAVKQRGRRGVLEWHRTAAPMSFTAITQLGFNGLDIVLLGILSTLYETGIYSAALRIALLIALIIRVLNIALGQKFSAHFASQRFERISQLYRKSTLVSMSVGGLMFLIVAFFPTEILTLFGGGFSDGALVLVVLAAGQLSGCIVGPVGMIHNMLGNHDFAAKSQAIWLTLAMGINIIIIPVYGALGAAFVTSSGLWFMRLHQWLYLRRQLADRQHANCEVAHDANGTITSNGTE